MVIIEICYRGLIVEFETDLYATVIRLWRLLNCKLVLHCNIRRKTCWMRETLGFIGGSRYISMSDYYNNTLVG